MQEMPHYAPIDTALGRGFIAYTPNGVAMLGTRIAERAFVEQVTDALGARPVRSDPPATLLKQVHASMQRGDGSAVDWTAMPAFQRKVLKATARIPFGQVRSYGDIADRIGAPRAQRAVGTALARNPVPLLVPCHRVVRSDGALGNYGIGGTAQKAALLAAEGFVRA